TDLLIPQSVAACMASRGAYYIMPRASGAAPGPGRRVQRFNRTKRGVSRMQLTPLCDLELRYTSLESIDFGAGGQIYGTMEGTVSGERLRGRLRLTNLAPRRPDNV